MLTMFVSCVLLAQPPDRIPVVLTTDCGVEVDDQWALTHLAISPRVDLRGVITTHAPGQLAPASARSAEAVLDLLTFSNKPPVVAGSSRPLASKTTPIPNPGVDLILKTTRDGTPERRIKLFVIGAATDAASALLIDPTLADRVEIVAMGFDDWPDGRDPWNVKNDVKAWQVLLASQAPLVVGDGAIGKKYLAMSPTEAHRRLDSRGKAGKALVDRLESWTREHGDMVAGVTGSKEVWPIWDQVTVAYILGLTEVDEHSRPALNEDLSFAHPKTDRKIRWVRSVQTDALWRDLAEQLR